MTSPTGFGLTRAASMPRLFTQQSEGRRSRSQERAAPYTLGERVTVRHDTSHARQPGTVVDLRYRAGRLQRIWIALGCGRVIGLSPHDLRLSRRA